MELQEFGVQFDLRLGAGVSIAKSLNDFVKQVHDVVDIIP
jgi:hypothetical protein